MKYKICHIILFVAAVGMVLPTSVGAASEEPVIIGVPLPLNRKFAGIWHNDEKFI